MDALREAKQHRHLPHMGRKAPSSYGSLYSRHTFLIWAQAKQLPAPPAAIAAAHYSLAGFYTYHHLTRTRAPSLLKASTSSHGSAFLAWQRLPHMAAPSSYGSAFLIWQVPPPPSRVRRRGEHAA